jgi:hypothetical protein
MAPAFVPGSGAPPPRNAYDIAWSEYNHHWAGLLVTVMGLAALAHRSGKAPLTRHWPLLFLFLAAFLFLRADPEVWPMGEIGIITSLKDPEVAQHRLFVALIVAFALFEWRVRVGRVVSRTRMRVFPLLGGRWHAIAHPFARARQCQGRAALRNDASANRRAWHRCGLGALARDRSAGGRRAVGRMALARLLHPDRTPLARIPGNVNPARNRAEAMTVTWIDACLR